MDAASAKLLDRFANAANKSILHPLDQLRFDEFIIDAFNRHVRIDPDEIRAHLRAAKLPEDMARDLAAFYDRGRELLEHFTGQS